MKLTDAQWELIAPVLPEPKSGPGKRGRPPRPFREVLDGILWVMRTGAPWHDLPRRYPPYQTCHRRFQHWCEDGTFEQVVVALRRDLRDRGGVEDIEGFIDGTYVPAKKGARTLANAAQARRPRSWQSQTAMVFHSLSLLLEQTDTTSFSPTELSMLRSWMSCPLD
jgi:transposase